MSTELSRQLKELFELAKITSDSYPAEKNNELLLLAAEKGFLEAVDAILSEDGVNVNATNQDGNTALHLAYSVGNSRITDRLIKAKANQSIPNYRGCLAKELDTYSHLSRSGSTYTDVLYSSTSSLQADHPTENTLNLLCRAVAERDLGRVKELLESNTVDINGKVEGHGSTPLHYAVLNSQKDCVKLLVSKGADLDIQDNRGFTPLDIANFKENNDIAEALTKKTLQQIYHPRLINSAITDALNREVEQFLNAGPECWNHDENSQFATDIRTESAYLVDKLQQAGQLSHDPMVYTASDDDGRKIYEIDLNQLCGQRIFMPKFQYDGSNMTVDGKQVMDILEIGLDGKVTGGTITPPPELSSISQDLMNQLEAIQAPGRSAGHRRDRPTRHTSTTHDGPMMLNAVDNLSRYFDVAPKAPTTAARHNTGGASRNNRQREGNTHGL